MTVEEPKKGRVAAALLAGSALTFSSFAIGIPAAVADTETPAPSPSASPTETPADSQPGDADGTDTEGEDADSTESGDEDTAPEPDEEDPEETSDPDSDDEATEGDDSEENEGSQDTDDEDEGTDESLDEDESDSDESELELDLDALEVAPGDSLQVSGNGFTPGESVEVKLIPSDRDKALASAEASATEANEDNDDLGGSFVLDIVVPEDAEAGQYVVVARDVTGLSKSESVTVIDKEAEEYTDPALRITPELIALEDFIGEDDEEGIGVVHEVVGLEPHETIDYSVTGPERVEPYEATATADEEGVADFTIQGYASDTPEVYVGEYTTVVTFGEDEASLEGSFKVIDETQQENPEIELDLDQVRAGEAVTVTGSGFQPDGEVQFELNPVLDVAQADENGEINAEVDIAADIEPGFYTFTAIDLETGNEASQELEVLAALTESALIIDPAEITLDDFIGEPEDGAGVAHRVEGIEPGTELSYIVTGPEGVNDYEATAIADDEGVHEFVIRGYDVGSPEVYLGDYVTVVTFENQDGETEELTGSFSVVPEEGTAGVSDDDTDTSDAAAPAVAAPPASGTPVDLNGTGLAQTGATSGQLGLLAGALLLVGGAFVAFANRARLFGRKS